MWVRHKWSIRNKSGVTVKCRLETSFIGWATMFGIFMEKNGATRGRWIGGGLLRDKESGQETKAMIWVRLWPKQKTTVRGNESVELDYWPWAWRGWIENWTIILQNWPKWSCFCLLLLSNNNWECVVPITPNVFLHMSRFVCGYCSLCR